MVILEDAPYRSLLNGVRNSLNVDGLKIQSSKPVGGWSKVFAGLEENVGLLEKFKFMHLLLLMDFDHQFEVRRDRFNGMVSGHRMKIEYSCLGLITKSLKT